MIAVDIDLSSPERKVVGGKLVQTPTTKTENGNEENGSNCKVNQSFPLRPEAGSLGPKTLKNRNKLRRKRGRK